MPRPAVPSVADIQRQLDRAVASIHEDLDLADHAKERMIREVYSEARSKVIQDAQEQKGDLEADLRAARRVAFAPPVLEVPEGRRPDPAIVAKWFYDEIDSLKEVTEPGELEKILQEALLMSNHPRAKACLIRGYELANSNIITKYYESYPDEKDFWDAYVEAAENFNEWERGMGMFSAPSRLKPLEHYLA